MSFAPISASAECISVRDAGAALSVVGVPAAHQPLVPDIAGIQKQTS